MEFKGWLMGESIGSEGLMWVNTRRAGAPSGSSAPWEEAEGMGRKADVAARSSAQDVSPQGSRHGHLHRLKCDVTRLLVSYRESRQIAAPKSALPSERLLPHPLQHHRADAGGHVEALLA